MSTISIPLEPIEPQKLYPLDAFMRAAGMGKSALRAARRNGLTVKYVGCRAYVKGSDFIDYVDVNGKTER